MSTQGSLHRPRATGPKIPIYADWKRRHCERWIDYLKDHGFRTNVQDEPSRSSMRRHLGVPDSLAGSRVALVQGYIIEGRVPAKDFLCVLVEHPRARGLSVTGQPAGSPGIEGLDG